MTRPILRPEDGEGLRGFEKEVFDRKGSICSMEGMLGRMAKMNRNRIQSEAQDNRSLASPPRHRSTTILSVRHKGKVALAGDGQLSFGETIMKHTAKKVRRLYHDRVVVGFSGAAADAFALFSKFEAKLEEYNGNIPRAAVELARDWRTDRMLRRLEALLAVVDKDYSYIISGTGDVIEPDDGIIGIGSGGPYAMAAARALVKFSDLDARQIVEEAMKIAASLCVYTNEKITIEEI